MIKDKRLMYELKDSRRYIWYNVFFQFIRLITNVIVIFAIGKLLQDTIIERNDMSILKTLVLIFIMILIRFGATIGANRMSFKATAHVKMILRDKLYEKLLKLGSSYHEKISTSEVVQIASEGIEQLEIYIGRYLPQLYYSILAPVSLFILISTFSFRTAIILLLCVPLIPLSIIMFHKIAKRITKKYWNTYAELGDIFLDNLQGLTTLKIYGADEIKHNQMNKGAENFRMITMKLLNMQLNSIIIMNIIAFGGAAASIIMAVGEYSQGNIVLWQAFSIIMLGAEFFIPLRLLGSYFHVAMNGTTACEKLFSILDFEEREMAKTENRCSEKHRDFEVSMDNLSFGYTDGKKVLKNISLKIKKGQFVSIVGGSGCGKSTVAALIMGYLSGYSGNLYISGFESRGVTEKEKMKKITLISHDSYIFKGTVRENLLMGNINATEEEMLNALEKVKLKDFVMSDGGLNFKIMEQGSNMSGGQKQRLAIARAFLHNSDVYIFDEATSNIDVESERCILEVIYELVNQKTIILISHRLANVVESDKIYMMGKGTIKEAGNHNELMDNDGFYREMYENQHNLEQFGRGETSIA